jgi:hypothetical protein
MSIHGSQLVDSVAMDGTRQDLPSARPWKSPSRCIAMTADHLDRFNAAEREKGFRRRAPKK